MCGRYGLTISADDVQVAFDLRNVTDEYEKRYNAAPDQRLPVILDAGEDELTMARWGLVPSWQDEPGSGYVNARSETVHEKDAFRDSYSSRRCLVPASGFFEWTDTGVPYYFSSEEVFAFAGLWDIWADNEQSLRTFTILTTDADDTVGVVHDRMPLVLPVETARDWLDTGTTVDDVEAAGSSCELESRAVSRAVNDTGNDDPGVIEPVTDLHSFA